MHETHVAPAELFDGHPPANAPIHVQQFGRDHWMLLAYIQSRCEAAGGVGVLEPDRLRCHPTRHADRLPGATPTDWLPSHGTRLAGFITPTHVRNPAAALRAGVLRLDHDDWDCLDDLARVGLVRLLAFVTHGVRLTAAGATTADRLFAHKLAGGTLSNFTSPALPPPA